MHPSSRKGGAARLGSLALLSTASLLAAQVTWDGGGANNNWATGDNWSTNGVPAAGDSVVFDSAGLAVRQPTINATGSVTGIALNATPTISLTNFNNTFSVSGAVTGSGGLVVTTPSTYTSNLGILAFTSTASNFAGGVTVQGSGIVRYTPASANTSFGAGTITVDGGTFSVGGPEIAVNASGAPTGNGGTDRSLLNTIAVTATGGTINMSVGSGSNAAAIAYNHVTLGGPVTMTSAGGGNADGYTIAGTLTLQQDAARTLRLTNNTGHNGSDWISGTIVDGAGTAANPLRIAVPGRGLQISGASNTYAGGTIIEATTNSGTTTTGLLAVTATGTLGSGNLTVEAGGRITLANATILGAAGNLGVSATVAVQAGGAVGVSGEVDFSSRLTAGSAGVLGVEGTRSAAIDLADLGNGQMFLGSVSGGTFSGALSPGLGGTFRLGGGSGNNLGTLHSVPALVLNGTNQLTGSADLVVGSGAQTGASYGRVTFSAHNDFTGDVVVNVDGLLTTSLNGGTPFGNASNPITVHGILAAGGVNGVFSAGVMANANLRPGSTLMFRNDNFANSTGGANGDRWGDTTPVTLTGAALQLFGARSADASETVGTVTFSGSSAIQSRRAANTPQDNILTVAGVSRQDRGILAVSVATAANLGGDTDNSAERVVVADTSGLGISNGMVAPWAVDSTGFNFLRYNTAAGTGVAGTRGLAAVTYTQNAATALNSAGATDIVNNSGVVILASDPTVYALRYADTVNVSGANDTITITSGGVIGAGNNKTNNAVMTSGSAEFIYWALGGNQTFANNAAIQTTGGFTKAGGNTLNLTNTNTAADYAITGGIVVQQGTLVSGTRFALALDDNLLTVNHEGRLNINDVASTVLGLSGVGSGANVNNSGATLRDFTISLASGTQTYEGRLSGNLNLVKSGNGTQVLAGTATFAGTTLVDGGVLRINGDFSGAAGAVTVSGGTLAGTGRIGGTTTIGALGTLAPGASPGLLSFSSGLVLGGAAIFEIDGTTRGVLHDAVDVGGTLTYGGTLTAVVGLTLVDALYTFDLLDFSSQGGQLTALNLTGNAVGTLDTGNNWTTLAGGYNWSFDHGTGVLTAAIPEPSTAAFLGAMVAFLAMAAARRGRR